MDYNLFIKALLISFFFAIPFGPVNLLCVRRTLTWGRICGFVSGLGAATADALYGYAAAFGLKFIISFLIQEETVIQIGSGIILLVLGVKTLLSKDSSKQTFSGDSGLFRNYVSMFLLTITNPLTILAYVAAFASFGVAVKSNDFISSCALVLGMFTGSTLWWFTLSGIVNLFRRRFNKNGIRWLNIISGIIIAFLGVITILGFI